MMGKLYYWVANWNLSRAQAARLLGNSAADMVDCTSSSLGECIRAYPAVMRFAGYITGTSDIRWSDGDFARIPHDCAVLRIDQSNQDLPLLSDVRGIAKDDESGASTVAESIHVAGERLRRGDDYTIYCSQAFLAEVEDAAAAAGLPHGHIVAYQWASPTSNPNTLLPGTDLTLKQANADLSVVDPAWLPLPGEHHTPAPVPKRDKLAQVRAEVTLAFNERTGHWKVEHADTVPLPWG